MQGTLWVQEHPWAQQEQPEMLQGSFWGLFAFGLHLARMETFSLLLETTPVFIRWGSQP